MTSMISTDFLRELERFSFVAQKRVSSQYTGARRSTKVGRGTDAYGFREYERGDDFRTIDWKVFARTEKLYVRQFEEYRDLVTHILLDASGSMDYPAEGLNKYEYGAMLALGFAYLVMKDNEKFAISTFTDDINISKPGRGRVNLLASIDQLNTTKPGGSTGFNEPVQQYGSLIKSKSRVIIISDFLAPPDDIKPALYRMGRHDLIVIQVLDPGEIELDELGAVKLHDLETREQMFTDINTGFVLEYNSELQSHNAALKLECDRLGADFYTFRTDLSILEAIYRTIHGR